MAGYKQVNDESRSNARVNSEGVGLCAGLSRANAEFVLDYLRTRGGNESAPLVVRTFFDNFQASLDATTSYKK